MKTKHLIGITIFFALLSSCVKNIEDEQVTTNFVKQFSYGGYVYYISEELGVMTRDEAIAACASCDALGFNDWFLPSRGELEAALRKYPYGFGCCWTSSYSESYYYYHCNGDGWHTTQKPGNIYISVYAVRKK